MAPRTKGVIITLAAGIAWGISGISGQYLMEQGVHVDLLTALRLFVSGLVLVVLIGLRRPDQLKAIVTVPQSLGRLVLFSLLGLMLNQYAYLSAVQHTNAGTATVLQYMAPVLIVAYLSLKNRSWPTALEFLAIGLALTGTFLMATHGQTETLAITPAGLFWGLLSACTYSAYILLPARLIKTYGSLPVIGLAMLLGGLVFPFLTQAWQYQLPLNVMNLLALFGLIGVGTVFAYTAFLKGVSLVGAVEGSLLASVEPVAAVFFTVVFMGETFYPVDLAGIALIIGAVLLIALKDYRLTRKRPRDLGNTEEV